MGRSPKTNPSILFLGLELLRCLVYLGRCFVQGFLDIGIVERSL